MIKKDGDKVNLMVVLTKDITAALDNKKRRHGAELQRL